MSHKPGRGFLERKAEKFRAYNNAQFLQNLDDRTSRLKSLLTGYTSTADPWTFALQTREDLVKGHVTAFKEKLIIASEGAPSVELKVVDIVNVPEESSSKTTESETQDVSQDSPEEDDILIEDKLSKLCEQACEQVPAVLELVKASPLGKVNVLVDKVDVRVYGSQGLSSSSQNNAPSECHGRGSETSQEKTLSERCDPGDCEDCQPLPRPFIPKIGSGSVVIYAGPGSGKTTLIASVKKAKRSTIYDTDHMKIGEEVPANSLLFTDRPDIVKSYHGVKIAFVPYKKHWMRLCLKKYPQATEQWFHDQQRYLIGCLLLRRNSHISDCVRLIDDPG